MFRSHQIEQIICLANDMSYPLIVAIDGLAGAGKSTLAKQLVAQMPNANCVNIDDFYRPIHFDQVIKLGSYELIESFFLNKLVISSNSKNGPKEMSLKRNIGFFFETIFNFLFIIILFESCDKKEFPKK